MRYGADPQASGRARRALPRASAQMTLRFQGSVGRRVAPLRLCLRPGRASGQLELPVFVHITKLFNSTKQLFLAPELDFLLYRVQFVPEVFNCIHVR